MTQTKFRIALVRHSEDPPRGRIVGPELDVPHM